MKLCWGSRHERNVARAQFICWWLETRGPPLHRGVHLLQSEAGWRASSVKLTKGGLTYKGNQVFPEFAKIVFFHLLVRYITQHTAL